MILLLKLFTHFIYDLLSTYQCPASGISGKGALVKDDHVSCGEVKITVFESEDFGDVVRVDPGV